MASECSMAKCSKVIACTAYTSDKFEGELKPELPNHLSLCWFWCKKNAPGKMIAVEPKWQFFVRKRCRCWNILKPSTACLSSGTSNSALHKECGFMSQCVWWDKLLRQVKPVIWQWRTIWYCWEKHSMLSGRFPLWVCRSGSPPLEYPQFSLLKMAIYEYKSNPPILNTPLLWSQVTMYYSDFVPWLFGGVFNIRG